MDGKRIWIPREYHITSNSLNIYPIYVLWYGDAFEFCVSGTDLGSMLLLLLLLLNITVWIFSTFNECAFFRMIFSSSMKNFMFMLLYSIFFSIFIVVCVILSNYENAGVFSVHKCTSSFIFFSAFFARLSK